MLNNTNKYSKLLIIRGCQIGPNIQKKEDRKSL